MRTGVALGQNLISIHAPREGGDESSADSAAKAFLFQSTPPARGATVQCTTPGLPGQISIHAPREGGD